MQWRTSVFKWGIDNLVFSGGEKVAIHPASILILIGPNSSGKTTVLKDIDTLLSRGEDQPVKAILDIETFLEGDADQFLSWFQDSYPSTLKGSNRFFLTKGLSFGEQNFAAVWEHLISKNRSYPIFKFLCHKLDTESRLRLGNPTSSRNIYEQHPEEYIHITQLDERLMEQISAEVRKAFGKSLIINWAGGNGVWFHVGDEPERNRERDRVSAEYIKELNQLPHLETEGDGIRSFVGTLLAFLCGNHPVLLIDEPEAFLHPPQIRRLTGLLAKNAEESNRQIIIATHSGEVIRGALSQSERVAICRVTRQDDSNHAALLESERIRELWAKPLLRSAAAVDGVFHNGVVVCESDSDSRFYEALVHRLEPTGSIQSPADFYFIHGGGKGELATLARVYIDLRVPVAVIADLDILKTRGEFQKLFSLLGGNFDRVQGIYNSTVSALNNLPPHKSVADFLYEAREVLNRVEEQIRVAPEDRKALIELINYSGDWSEAKKYGIRKLRGGEHEASIQLLTVCKEVGLFLVPYGELERWWDGGPSDKNEWFARAIELITADQDSFSEASQFMADVCNHLLQA